jgi:hypothetical protein
MKVISKTFANFSKNKNMNKFLSLRVISSLILMITMISNSHSLNKSLENCGKFKIRANARVIGGNEQEVN